MNSPKSAICGTYRYSVARGVFLRRQPGLTRDGKITWISTLFKLVIRTSGDFFMANLECVYLSNHVFQFKKCVVITSPILCEYYSFIITRIGYIGQRTM